MEEPVGATLQDVVDELVDLQDMILDLQNTMHSDLSAILLYILIFFKIVGILISFYVARWFWKSYIIGYIRAFWKINL